MRSFVLLMLAIWLGHAAAAKANDPLPEFVWSFTLEPQFDSDVWRVQLTPDIMQRLNRDSADDLVIVDRQGRTVPFAHVARALFRDTVEIRQPLVFEGDVIQQDQTERPELSLEFEHNGARLRVNAPETESRFDSNDSLRYEALLAVRGRNIRGSAPASDELLPLRIEFQTEQRINLRCWLRPADSDAPATLSASLTTREASRPLRYVGEFQVPLGEASWHLACYGAEAVPDDLELVQAERMHTLRRDLQRRSTLVPKIERITESPEIFQFELPAPYRADLINLISSEQRVFSRVQVRSRANPQDHWRNRGEISISTLENANNQPLVLNQHSDRRDRYWQLAAEPPLGHVPQLEFHALEDTLVFLAQGQPPWRLQVGSFEGVVPTIDDASLRELSQSLGAVMQWPEINVSEVERIGSDQLLSEATDWSRYLLWLVLVIGSLIVVVMAVRLLRSSSD